jgi:hypothetical protein
MAVMQMQRDTLRQVPAVGLGRPWYCIEEVLYRKELGLVRVFNRLGCCVLCAVCCGMVPGWERDLLAATTTARFTESRAGRRPPEQEE